MQPISGCTTAAENSITGGAAPVRSRSTCAN